MSEKAKIPKEVPEPGKPDETHPGDTYKSDRPDSNEAGPETKPKLTVLTNTSKQRLTK